MSIAFTPNGLAVAQVGPLRGQWTDGRPRDPQRHHRRRDRGSPGRRATWPSPATSSPPSAPASTSAGSARSTPTACVVTPGFVDIHTHYDGQVTWDGVIAPSSLHGVTSIVMGNCGVGFAPARPTAEQHDWLIGLLEGVEDIPGTALAEGLPVGLGDASPTTSTRSAAAATPSTSAPRWPTPRCAPTSWASAAPTRTSRPPLDELTEMARLDPRGHRRRRARLHHVAHRTCTAPATASRSAPATPRPTS